MAVVHVTNETFEKEVLQAEDKVLVDFWASWCGPCRMLGPVIDQLGSELTDVKVCKIDVDANQDLAARYKVETIPTLVVFAGGEEVKRSVGVQPKPAILAMLK
ncbi:thioredoxin [uncultured Phascolarctobacterium sp.]|uniref:thioredoxin n=1 Tax=uncultured Phascolarctobacterium sp. TaxID=512296 RepID=UPI00260DE7FA|nr:thioredoxin [uncultured Phascolarctobacterium sp.]